MTPDTGNYMVAGYVVILGGMLAYVVSLAVRLKNRAAELRRLEADSEEHNHEE